jgi:FtsH-binding integral membrane protein
MGRLFAMAGIATVTKKDFSFWEVLFIGLVLLVVASLATCFPDTRAAGDLGAFRSLIFSAYILYDVSNIIRWPDKLRDGDSQPLPGHI